MKDDLIAIREGIKAGRYANEAAISQGIVLRLLHALSWPTYNTDVVSPEFSLQGRRVDYALCHPPEKPLVFIEVKQRGQSDGADRQLFEYAFHAGVPMVVLTDGQEWHFYLPAEQGSYTERRVYKLDILERDVDESTERLRRYLDYRHICSGEAIEAARRDYRDVAKDRQVREALPEAWRKLQDEPDELLLELLADKVESLCGYKPTLPVVAKFLSGEHLTVTPEMPKLRPSTSRTLPRMPPGATVSTGTASPVGFTIDGQFTPARPVRYVLIKIIQHFAKNDSSFLARFAALPKHGRQVRYIARTRHELNPERPDLAEHSYEVFPGWWVYVHLSHQQIVGVIKRACDITGVHYGSRVRLNLK